MGKPGTGEMVYCGVDVGAEELVVAVLCGDRAIQRKVFRNHAAGHQALIGWLAGMGGCVARVSLEATGMYSLNLALALEDAAGVEVAVLNPKSMHDFARSQCRSKTDRADAEVLAEYCRRMEFKPWARPSVAALRLRSVARHLSMLMVDRTRDRNRLHAAEQSVASPRCVVRDLKRGLAGLEKRVEKLRREARTLIAGDVEMERRFGLLVAIPGIGEISAIDLLAELGMLAPGLTARQWVAASGLDPAHETSGSSVRKPSRMSRKGSRHLRRALFMPALVAVRRDPHLGAFYQQLLGRHKAKLQALIAVARKMLHAIFGVFKTNTPYDGARLFPTLTPA
jgi:transposase